MKRLVLILLSITACVGPGRMGIRFPDDPDATETTGPISFYCLREGALEGKPTNTLVCIEHKKWEKGMEELKHDLQQLKSQLKSEM